MSVIHLHSFSFAWPDSTPCIPETTLAIPTTRTGVVGDNGSGKTTFASLVAGELEPSTGTLEGTGRVTRIAQRIAAPPRTSEAVPSEPEEETPNPIVADVLGIAEALRSLHTVLAGSGTEEDFDRIGSDWDLEEQALSALARTGLALGAEDLLRPVSTFSGGEVVRIGLSRAVLDRADLTILDEPTNNLDTEGRAALFDLVESWDEGLLVISHDKELLERMSVIVELEHGIHVYPGNFTAYRDAKEAEEAERLQDLTDARKDLATARRLRIEQESKAARGKAYGKKQAEGMPKILANAKKAKAEATAGNNSARNKASEAKAQASADEAWNRKRKEIPVAIDLPDTGMHAGKQVLRVVDAEAAAGESGPRGVEPLLEIIGLERVRLTGANGSGKSTFLRALVDASENVVGFRAAHGTTDRSAHPDRPGSRLGGGLEVHTHVDLGYIDQDHALPVAETVLEAIRIQVPEALDHDIRARLAALGMRAGAADKRIDDLSGGERFRVALAAVLVRDPGVGLLVLDEPTNNLDMRSVDVLVAALSSYTGALLLVSHDPDVVARLGVTREIDVAELRGDAPAV